MPIQKSAHLLYYRMRSLRGKKNISYAPNAHVYLRRHCSVWINSELLFFSLIFLFLLIPFVCLFLGSRVAVFFPRRSSNLIFYACAAHSTHCFDCCSDFFLNCLSVRLRFGVCYTFLIYEKRTQQTIFFLFVCLSFISNVQLV